MITSERNLYVLDTRLCGHQGPISCVCGHPEGLFVACGGNNGTTIWHLLTSRMLNTPTQAGERGMTTALSWISKADTADDCLVYGTQDGYLCIWRCAAGDEDFVEIFCQQLEAGLDDHEITALAFEPSSSQLAVAHRSGVIHRFFIDGSMKPRPMRSVTIPLHCPQTVAFGHTGVKGVELWSFGRESGEIIIIDESASVLKTLSTGAIIGHGVLSLNDDLFLLDDVAQGVALYRLSSYTRLKTLPVSSDTMTYRSRNISLHDHSSAILSGSDHGVVYIFDRRSGDVKDLLPIAQDWVQAVASSDINGTPVIFAGCSSENVNANELQVWRKRANTTAAVKGSSVIEKGKWFLCVVLASLFILENVLQVPLLGWLRNIITTGIDWIKLTINQAGNIAEEWRLNPENDGGSVRLVPYRYIPTAM